MRWSRRLLGLGLLTAFLSAGAAVGLVSSAAASTPQPVTIDTAFQSDPQSPGCGVNPGTTIVTVFSGPIFPGRSVTGTVCVIAASGTHVPKTFDHSIVDTSHRTDVYIPNDGSGTFTLGINKVSTFIPGPACPMIPGVTFPDDQCNTIAYKGSATVKGGTGAYTNLHGTLSFTSKEIFDTNPSVFDVVSGIEHMAGSLHIDP